MPNDAEMMNEIAGAPGPSGPAPMGGGPAGAMAGPPPGAGPAGPGGPMAPNGGPNRIDTPQEQKAMQLFMQGSLLFREAANLDPSVRFIVDQLLVKGFTDVTKHYGLEQEGKLALQQAQLTRTNDMRGRVMGGQPSQPQPPAVPPGPPGPPVR